MNRPSPPPSSAKDISIESLRAVAVSLVIGFHIRSDPSLGEASNTYEWLAYTFRNIRIPLFTAISGYLYAARPVAADRYWEFVTGKLRRLLVPLLVVSTLEYLFHVYGPGADRPALRDIWRIYVLPYSHYWFLQAVILVMLLVGALDARGLLARFEHWLVATVLAFVSAYLSPFQDGAMEPLSLGGFLALLPFFLLGIGVVRFRDQLLGARPIGAMIVVFVVTCVVLQVNWVHGDTLIDSSKKGATGLLFGISSCLLLLRYRPRNRFLAWVGGFSFAIYLFQAFGAGLGRRFIAIPGINPHLYFLALLSFTVAFGIFVDLAASRFRATRVLLLGKR